MEENDDLVTIGNKISLFVFTSFLPMVMIHSMTYGVMHVNASS